MAFSGFLCHILKIGHNTLLIIEKTPMSSSFSLIRIGTRGSQLALVQANLVKEGLQLLYPESRIELRVIQTSGDMLGNQSLAQIGGKGLFIKEIEDQLLSGDIDIAVHSMKDMPAKLHPQMDIPCILKRENPRDVLISHQGPSLMQLPKKARVGTSSPRRASQLLHLRPDVTIVPFRGNVPTRLQKLNDGHVDATLLAFAGLKRLDIFDATLMHVLETDVMLPAVAQGAIGIEILKNNETMRSCIAPLHHSITGLCIATERAFLSYFDEGSCTTPIAALAQLVDDEHIQITGLIASMDGKRCFRKERVCPKKMALETALALAAELKHDAGDHIFA